MTSNEVPSSSSTVKIFVYEIAQPVAQFDHGFSYTGVLKGEDESIVCRFTAK